MVGMFPPPLHGMSLINDHVRQFIAETETPHIIDFSPRKLDRSLLVRMGKLFRVGVCLVEFALLLMKGRVRCVYLGLSGGNGQLYDAAFAGLSRLFGKKLYFHHHSYQYLNQSRLVAKFLMAVGGKNAIHVVACEKMARDLRRLYPIIGEVRIISGIAALELWKNDIVQRNEMQSIGFLSNISIEKGVLEFLEVAERASQRRMPLRFLLAGPFQDEEVREIVEKRITNLKNIAYIGAVYAEQKQAFFDSIDLFLFPTRYVNESEGLVIHEAMGRGVPVIAYSRGCIEQIVSEQVGLPVNPSADFVAITIDKITEWLAQPLAYQSISKSALSQFRQAQTFHRRGLESFCADLLQGK